YCVRRSCCKGVGQKHFSYHSATPGVVRTALFMEATISSPSGRCLATVPSASLRKNSPIVSCNDFCFNFVDHISPELDIRSRRPPYQACRPGLQKKCHKRLGGCGAAALLFRLVANL